MGSDYRAWRCWSISNRMAKAVANATRREPAKSRTRAVAGTSGRRWPLAVEAMGGSVAALSEDNLDHRDPLLADQVVELHAPGQHRDR